MEINKNPRIGRFFAVDPLESDYPFNSPYAFSENKVIQYVELEGIEVGEPGFNSARGAELLISRDAGATSWRGFAIRDDTFLRSANLFSKHSFFVSLRVCRRNTKQRFPEKPIL